MRKPYEEFKPIPFQYEQDVEHDGVDAFVVGGQNSDRVIQNMTHLTGVPLETLQARAKPLSPDGRSTVLPLTFLAQPKENQNWKGSSPTKHGSSYGFIRSGQNLRNLLLHDNRTVRSMGLTHQQIAEPLLKAMEIYEKSKIGKEGEKEGAVRFTYNGRKYLLESRQVGGADGNTSPGRAHASGWTEGFQGAFFNDHLFTNYLFTITDVETGEKLKSNNGSEGHLLDGLTPHLIYRYGFYQGGDFRIDPVDIARFFHLADGKYGESLHPHRSADPHQ